MNKWDDIRQSEAAECGLACLAQIAGWYGHHTSLQRLRQRFGMSLRGATLESLVTIADALGLTSRPVRFDMEDLKELSLPCVLHWDFKHFVTLKSVGSNFIQIHDPAKGPLKISLADASRHLTGIALELTPNSMFRKRQDRDIVKLSSFWSSLHGIKRSLFQLAVYALILEIFELAGPMYLQFVIDEAVGKGDINLVGVLAFGIIIIALFQVVIQYIRSHTDLTMSTSISRQVHTNLFSHMIRLPLGWFERRQIGDVVSRFSSLGPVQTSLTAGVINVGLDGLFSIVTLTLMVIYSIPLTLISLGVLAIALLIRFLSFASVKGLTHEQIDSQAKEDTAFIDVLRSIRPIKAFAREDERGTIWQNAYARLITSNIQIARLNIRIESIESIVWAVHGVLILYVGALAIMSKQLSVGMLLAFQAYNSQFNGRLTALVTEILSFRMLKLHLFRLSDIARSDREDQGRPLNPILVEGSLHFSNVEYKYSPVDRPALYNVNLKIDVGECIAILGPSGCGKSTLVKLLAGLVAPTKGDVFVDGNDLSKADLRAYRRQIGVVMQDDTLMSGTIFENITFFSSEPSQEWAEECARQSLIHDDILRMPMGYTSLVGDNGNALSGGQKQRLLLARALYQRPRILIIDEGTANLDMETEEKIVFSLGKLPITRIMVTHRPKLLAIADRTITFENGRMVDQDSHISSARS